MYIAISLLVAKLHEKNIVVLFLYERLQKNSVEIALWGNIQNNFVKLDFE